MRADSGSFLAVVVAAAALALGTGPLDRAVGPYSDWTGFAIPHLSFVRPDRASVVSIPLWNPYIFCGYPYLADPQTSPFHPFWWLLLPFPLEEVPRPFAFLHLLVAAWGAYRYARLDLRPVAALGAALVYGAGGVLVPQIYAGRSPMLPAISFLPWGMLGARRLAASPLDRGGFLLVAATTGFSLLGGPLPTAVVAPALAGVSLVPAAAEVVRSRPRSDVAGYEYATVFSWAPAYWPTFVAPFAGGDPLRRSFPRGNPDEWAEMTCWIGWVAAGVALLGLVRGRAEGETRRAAALALGGMLLAAGRHGPLYPLLYAVFPAIGYVRVPARLLLLSAWGLSLLVARGLETVRRRGLAALLLLASAVEIVRVSGALMADGLPLPRWRPIALEKPHERVALGLYEANVVVPLRLRSPDGYAAFVSRRYLERLRSHAESAGENVTIDRRETAALRALGVRYVRPFAEAPPTDFRPHADPRFWIYEDALPRARVVDAAGRRAGSVEWIEDGADRVVLDVEVERDAVLALADAWHPDWVARLDGRPVEIEVRDGAFRAVRLSPGRHRVEMEFRPWPLLAGAGLTVAAAGGLVAWAAPLRRRRPPAVQSRA